MEFQRFCLHPFAVLPVKSFLGNFADVDFGVEVCGESLVVVTCVAIYYVEILNLVEVMLGSVSSEYTCYTRVKPASEDGAESCLLETLAISPLP